MHLFPYLSGLTGCGCLGIIIIISGRLFEPKLEPRLCTPDSSHFQDSSLFKREGKEKEEGWNRRLSRGLFITEISSTCTLYCFFKGAYITKPDLVKVLIKGLLYCSGLHNCVRRLWGLMIPLQESRLLSLTWAHLPLCFPTKEFLSKGLKNKFF